MEEPISIVKILIRNIFLHDSPVKESLNQNLAKFRYLPEMQDCLDLEHKNHSDFVIQTHLCKENHCVECLVSKLAGGYCSHGLPFSPFEQMRIPKLVENLPEYSEEKVVNNKCNVCKEEFKSECTRNRACRCQICDRCFIKLYKMRELACKLCGKSISIETISTTAEKLGVEKPELNETCSSCNLVYPQSGIVNTLCYLCSERAKYEIG